MESENVAVKETGRQIQRILFYISPLLLVLVVVFLSATRFAGYIASWRLIAFFLNLLDYSDPPIDWRTSIESGVSIYKINNAFRNLSHIVLYAIAAAAAIRAVQFGAVRLKWLSLVAVVTLSVLFVAGDEFVRMHSTGRHAKPSDWWLNLFGVLIVLIGTAGRYGLRRWEAHLTRQEDSTKIP